MTARRPVALVALVAFLSACAGAPVADLRPGERPALDSDEAGLWMQMERVEHSLRTSGRVIRDAGIDDYVRSVVCRLSPEHCSYLNLYVVRTPHFNASMAPNGTLQVWTGLLLRVENEAQLAYVLGHEIGHYVRRHSVQRFRDARAKTDFTAFFSLLTAAAGVGFVGSLAQLVAAGSIAQFSRDQEREADEVGFELMVGAGYEPREAARIWQALLEERAAAKKSDPSIFFATHPSTEERVETLQRLAEARRADGLTYESGRERFLAAVAPLRHGWLRDELRARDFAATQVLLDRLRTTGAAPAEVEFFQGELYRLRAQIDDAPKAIEAYERALQFPEAPPDTWRSLGLVHLKLGHKAQARECLQRYLQAVPDARDREMIGSHLRALEEDR